MASSSTSPISKSFKYDVFLSFRGEDTRDSFVDHLYDALRQKGIETYKDDEKIKKGKRIRDDLFTSIEESRFYIIVFSKTYASSSWCLEELVKIMECQNMTEHTAYPVFYHVEPTEVRKQSGVVGEAFAKHENKEAAGKWRGALEDASHLAGWEYKNNGENKFIKQIVHEISLELRSVSFIVDDKLLVGMETRINEIVSSLETSSDDVRMFGIAGMGGAGKTTLARAVYDKISFLFEGKSFVGNVREVSSSLSGLITLQKQVISDVSKDQNITVSNVFDGKEQIIKSMHCRKVLVVLDDVDRIEQLEALAGDCNWFKQGSRIIITTRDKQVLISHRVMYNDVALLSDKEAICLLSRYAFQTETPIQGYERLSGQVVDYAAGLPLTIKVLGSKLCGADECTWKDIIERLKEIPLIETQKKLEISYDDLEEEHKEIFLDVACIMKGWRKDDAIRALDSCGRHGRYGLRILELKSLITISPAHGGERLGMHDHIQETGQNIVRRPYYDKPHMHSRLWKYDEIEEILAKDLGTEATTCIKLKMKSSSQIYFKGFREMENLRFLHLSSPYYQDKDKTNSKDEVSPYFPDALRYLFWEYYPFRCLPNTFRAKNLIRLEMPVYRSGQLWESGRREVLYNLKFLVLDYSFITTLNLGVTPNLEMLSLDSNGYLKELHMPDELQKLKSLALKNSTLASFDLGKTPNLETMDLHRCQILKELHIADECRKLKSFSLHYPKWNIVSLELASEIETLEIVASISLKTLDLRQAVNLKKLELSKCEDLVKLDMPVKQSKLESLSIHGSKLKTLHLREAVNIQKLQLSRCLDLVKLDMPVKQSKLKSLRIHSSKLSSFDLGLASNLKSINLRECYDLAEVHMHVGYPKLRSLVLLYLPKLRTLDFAMTPNLKDIRLDGCNDLVLQMPLKFPNLETLYLRKCSMLKTLRLQTPSLYSFHIESSYHLTDVMLGDCPMLKKLFLCEIPGVPLYLGGLGCLEELTFEGTKMKHLPDAICMLQRLRFLEVKYCSFLEKLPENLDQLECLERLILRSCGSLENIPSSIGKLRRLQYISLLGCTAVKKLPKELGSLECLKTLDIKDTGINHLPVSIVLFKDLLIRGSTRLLESYKFTSMEYTYDGVFYRRGPQK